MGRLILSQKNGLREKHPDEVTPILLDINAWPTQQRDILLSHPCVAYTHTSCRLYLPRHDHKETEWIRGINLGLRARELWVTSWHKQGPHDLEL